MQGNTVRNVLVVGAGVAGRLLARNIAARQPQVAVLGFVDDSPAERAHVLGEVAALPQLLQRYQVDEVAIALPSADGAVIRRILLTLAVRAVPIRIVPREQQVLRRNDVTYDSLRDVTADDFLGRPIVKRNVRKLEQLYAGKRVFVTGGAGSIGSEIVYQLLDLGVRQVLVYDNSEYLCYQLDQFLRERQVSSRKYAIVIGSVTHQEKMLVTLKRFQPDTVFHVAAYKHVHLMEENADEAIRTNVFGTRIAADAARAAGVKRFVFVSTDKVVNPTSVMGASKKIAEHYIQSLSERPTRYSIVRFGNVINSHGSVLPLFERQISEGRSITVTDPMMRRYFMSIREAAELVILSGTRSAHGDIFVLDMGDLISLQEVAHCFIRSKNLRPEIDVALKIIGRRPGEKLAEELFTAAERRRMQRTVLPHVWRLSRGRGWSPARLEEVLSRLEHLSDSPAQRRRLRTYLRELFPSLG